MGNDSNDKITRLIKFLVFFFMVLFLIAAYCREFYPSNNIVKFFLEGWRMAVTFFLTVCIVGILEKTYYIVKKDK